MTPDEIATGIQSLSLADNVLSRIIERVGACGLRPDRDPFTSLARAIVGQQVSIHAAAAIWSRFVTAAGIAGEVTPESVALAEFDALRSAGLSGSKARYVQDLAARFLDGTIQPDALGSMDDEKIITHLTQVKGVGRWTAEMFLIFSLGRPDVLPVDDLGLLNSVQRAWALPDRPAADSVRARAEEWRPWRSLATWYLWQSLRLAPLE
jgi:DNA-3-methyladenine glycosylase II